MSKLKDLTGQTFGRLTATSCTKIDNKVMWDCSCSCGSRASVLSTSLVQGKTKSCGCLKKELTSARFKTHGMAGSIEYRHYANMLSRCTNPNHPDYEHYTGRGIGVCQEFVESFESFYKEIGPKPVGKWSVGRISNIGNYEIGNIRWETDKEQAINHSMQRNNTSGHVGITVRSTEADGARVVSRYNDASGKRHSKSFSVLRHGLELAIKLAVAWREDRLSELVAEGVVYGEYHGLPDSTAIQGVA